MKDQELRRKVSVCFERGASVYLAADIMKRNYRGYFPGVDEMSEGECLEYAMETYNQIYRGIITHSSEPAYNMYGYLD